MGAWVCVCVCVCVLVGRKEWWGGARDGALSRRIVSTAAERCVQRSAKRPFCLPVHHPTPPHPHPPLQNAWRNPNLKGQWAKGGGGTLAAEERALLDAYGQAKGGK